MRVARHGRPLAWWALVGLLGAYAAMTLGAPEDPEARLALSALYSALLAGALVLCVGRARADRREAGAWAGLGGAVLLWLAGDAAFALGFAGAGFPNRGDALWLAGYPAAAAGLALLVRARARTPLGALPWLDAALAGTAASAVVAAVAVEPGDGPLEVAATLAYPLGDVALVALAAATWLALGRRARALVLAAGALALYGAADVARLLAAGELGRAPIEVMWPIGAILVGAAAACPAQRVRARREGRRRATVVAATLAATAALMLLAVDRHAGALPAIAVDLALLALVLLLARLGLALRENTALLARSREEALTDALTGLGNRRALMAALDDAMAVAHAGRPQMLAVFDLDGFKAYNDVFGHSAGDVLIEHLGTRLAAAVAPAGRAFRMGGDEFCVLAPDHAAPDALAGAAAALSEEGEGFKVDASVGVVSLPHDAQDAESALQLADRRMYRAKEARPGSAARQSGDVLLRALAERQPLLYEHVEAVAAMARSVAAAMGLDADGREAVARAAALHDVGKVAIPDAILSTTGPLEDDELAFMRRHTVIGQSIIEAAPALKHVAALVRASHERWDGAGYPDGLAGEEIPLGARIVAVCDAYSAMMQPRPYGEVREEAEALVELRRCAGTQFDPDVVKTFCRLRAQARRRRQVLMSLT